MLLLQVGSLTSDIFAATVGGNIVANITTANTSMSPAKMHLKDGIEALKNGNELKAANDLKAAQEALSYEPQTTDVIKHVEEGMEALESGDLTRAVMYLSAAE